MSISQKGRIFISYRRVDSSGYAGRIYDRLKTHFGKKSVFMDVVTIEAGLDFVKVLQDEVQKCGVLVVLIGRQWLDAKDETGNRRLDNPRDFVRVEIAAALRRKIRVIPVLIDGVTMPRPNELPEELAELARRNALQINHPSFDADVLNLIEQLKLALKAAEKPKGGVTCNLIVKRYIKSFGIGALIVISLVSLITGGIYTFRKKLITPINPTLAPISTNTPPSRPTRGSKWIQTIDNMTMVYVPAGKFEMGSNYGGSSERPVHTVNLDAYWIDQTEVTNAMYAKCVQAGNCDQPTDIKKFDDAKYKNHPVVYVSWIDADAYCKWAGRRLPTEAEWEKAASWDEEEQRKHVFPWGSVLDCSLANYWGKDGGCVGDTMVVGSFEGGKSSYDVYDMAGNVWEWVEDWYSETYFLISPSSNPSGPASGSERLSRGGGWFSTSSYLRSAGRYWYHPTTTKNNLGFRCVLSASE